MDITDISIDRRTAVAGLAAAAATASLAGCTRYSNSKTPDASSTAGGGLKTAEIPVGGGKIVGATVITQPVAGTFKAFSSTCTHQGCTVISVNKGKITCPCHGSMFSAADGSVLSGPARAPLPAKTVTVTGDSITVT